MRRRLVVQLQRPGQRIQHLWGRVAIPTLLEANVVVGADARKQRELVATQTGNTPTADVRDPSALGRDQASSGAEILAKRVPRHLHTINPGSTHGGSGATRLRGPLATGPITRDAVDMTSITTPITTP